MQQNSVARSLVELLQANNVAAQNDCIYLESAVNSWLNLAVVPQPASFLSNLDDTFVLWAQILPVRCPFQSEDGVITSCDDDESTLALANSGVCKIWEDSAPSNASEATNEYFASELGLRVDGISTITSAFDQGFPDYQVQVVYNENPTVSLVNMGLFFLLFGILIIGLYGLQALRVFAFRLVLDPLQRMLKIVLRCK